MQNATAHATAHCATTSFAAVRPFVSFFTVAIAATHGVYSNVNTRNAYAVAGVKIVGSKLTSPPSSTVSVDTTLSFAIKPVSKAVDARQSPKPNGANRGASTPPMAASKLESGDSATDKLASNVCRNHTTSVAMNTTVNAF